MTDAIEASSGTAFEDRTYGDMDEFEEAYDACVHAGRSRGGWDPCFAARYRLVGDGYVFLPPAGDLTAVSGVVPPTLRGRVPQIVWVRDGVTSDGKPSLAVFVKWYGGDDGEPDATPVLVDTWDQGRPDVRLLCMAAYVPMPSGASYSRAMRTVAQALASCCDEELYSSLKEWVLQWRRARRVACV